MLDSEWFCFSEEAWQTLVTYVMGKLWRHGSACVCAGPIRYLAANPVSGSTNRPHEAKETILVAVGQTAVVTQGWTRLGIPVVRQHGRHHANSEKTKIARQFGGERPEVSRHVQDGRQPGKIVQRPRCDWHFSATLNYIFRDFSQLSDERKGYNSVFLKLDFRVSRKGVRGSETRKCVMTE
jgi:hypothetical protein